MNSPSIGNTDLVEYGIFNEGSDIRAHVSVTAEKVYVFRTSFAVDILREKDYKRVPVYTGAIVTAEGFLVPVADLPHCPINIPIRWMQALGFREDESTSAKGDKAVRIVKRLLEVGFFPLPTDPEVIADASMQITGLDILVTATARIQVKCDYRAGTPGTGNLFLQTHECNPFRHV